MRIDFMAARSELQRAVTTMDVVSEENCVLKDEILGARATLVGAQVEYQSLVTKLMQRTIWSIVSKPTWPELCAPRAVLRFWARPALIRSGKKHKHLQRTLSKIARRSPGSNGR